MNCFDHTLDQGIKRWWSGTEQEHLMVLYSIMRSATLGAISNQKAALNLQLKAGVQSTTGRVSNKPASRLWIHPVSPTEHFTAGTRWDQAKAKLMSWGGWWGGWRRGCPRQCPLMGHPTLLPLRSATEPWEKWPHPRSLVGMFTASGVTHIPHDFHIYITMTWNKSTIQSGYRKKVNPSNTLMSCTQSRDKQHWYLWILLPIWLTEVQWPTELVDHTLDAMESHKWWELIQLVSCLL